MVGMSNYDDSEGRSTKQSIFDYQQFLSDDGSFVQAKCDLELYYFDDLKTKLEWFGANSSLRISNGEGVLNLGITSYSSKARQESIKTLETLIAALGKLRSAILYMDDQVVALEAEVERNNRVKEETIEPITE